MPEERDSGDEAARLHQEAAKLHRNAASLARDLDSLTSLVRQKSVQAEGHAKELDQKITEVEQELVFCTSLWRAVEQPVVRIKPDQTIEDATDAFFSLVQVERDVAMGQPIGGYVEGLATLNLPINMAHVPVSVKRGKKEVGLFADVVYFNYRGDDLRAGIYLTHPGHPTLARLAGMMPRRSGEMHIVAKKYTTGGVLAFSEGADAPVNELFGLLSRGYVNDKTNGAVVDFRDVADCDLKVCQDLALFTDTFSGKQERRYTVAVIHYNETVLDRLQTANFSGEYRESKKK